MQPKESLYPKDWFETAARDFKRAKLLFRSSDCEGAGFHLQQAVEKYLKGYLLSSGWRLKRIHDLEALLNAAIVYDAGFERFRSLCIKVTTYYIEERYPVLVKSSIETKNLEDEIKQALLLVKFITGK